MKIKSLILIFIPVIVLMIILLKPFALSQSIDRSKRMSKVEAFLTYIYYENKAIEELVECFNNDDAETLTTFFSEEASVGNETGYTSEDIISFVEGKVIDVEFLGGGLHKENNGLFGKHYCIDFYRSYVVKTEVNEYRVFYHYCFSNNDRKKIGLKSLGVAVYGEYEDSGYMYYDIPGAFICTNENKDTILELKEKYGVYSKR